MQKFKQDFLKSEYTEIGSDLRHINELRMRSIQYNLTLLGLLAVAASTVPEFELTNGQKTALHSIILFIGALVMILCVMLEFRLADIFRSLMQRGVEIEAEFYPEKSSNARYSRSQSFLNGLNGNRMIVLGYVSLVAFVGGAWWIGNS